MNIDFNKLERLEGMIEVSYKAYAGFSQSTDSTAYVNPDALLCSWENYVTEESFGDGSEPWSDEKPPILKDDYIFVYDDEAYAILKDDVFIEVFEAPRLINGWGTEDPNGGLTYTKKPKYYTEGEDGKIIYLENSYWGFGR